ncbi:MAG: flap endonuclease-1 [Candidatus Helarchaeota archaeon]|nr:flap endonuclease-1 [Candidatus Helarchaeota archaeon]
MGVKIKDLLEIEKITFSELKGKIVTVDAANTIYQFLSIIQPTTGLPLMDDKKRITSHLSGIFYRNINLIEKNIKPIYVFDGKPPKLKGRTIKERRAGREDAYKQWKTAIEEGDIEAARKYGQAAHRMTSEIVAESKKLLTAMGIPIVQAPSEGEAQASFMIGKDNIWAVASQDFDSILFGAPRVIRNLSLSERRRIPRTNQYIRVEPELINSSETFQNLKISREQLIDIGILVGTDFNMGIKGVGAKTALKLILKYKDLKTVIKEKAFEFDRTEEELEEIRNFFLQPHVHRDYKIEFKKHDPHLIKTILINEHQFSSDRVNKGLKRIEKVRAVKQQRSLDKWF